MSSVRTYSALDNKCAVVVGVAVHADPSLPPFESAVEDARLCASTLSRLQFRPEVLTTAAPDTPATFASIKNALSAAAGQRGADTLVFAFIGNGVASGSDFFLLPSDARSSDLPGTALSLPALCDLLQCAASRRVLLLLDVARAASPRSRSARAPLPAAFVDRVAELSQKCANSVIISACRPGEHSYTTSHGTGVLIQSLVDGLRGACPPDAQGNISAFSLASFVARRVPQLTQGRQNPFVLVHGDASFVVASAAARAAFSSSSADTRPSPPTSGSSALDLAFTPLRLRTRTTDWFVNGTRVEPRRSKPVSVPYGVHRIILTATGLGSQVAPIRVRLHGAGRGSRVSEVRLPKDPVGARFSVHFLLAAGQPRHFVRVLARAVADHLDVDVLVDGKAYRRVATEKEISTQTFWVEFL